MSNKGTPSAGLQEIARRVFTGPAYSLVAYTNTQGSLGAATVASDLIQPTQANGYAPIVLNGIWSFTAGIATYVHSGGATDDGFGNPCWYPTGAWSAPVTGVALIYNSIVQHFVDYVDATG